MVLPFYMSLYLVLCFYCGVCLKWASINKTPSQNGDNLIKPETGCHGGTMGCRRNSMRMQAEVNIYKVSNSAIFHCGARLSLFPSVLLSFTLLLVTLISNRDSSVNRTFFPSLSMRRYYVRANPQCLSLSPRGSLKTLPVL